MINKDVTRIPFFPCCHVDRGATVEQTQTAFDELTWCYEHGRTTKELELALYCCIAADMERYSSAFDWARSAKLDTTRQLAELTMCDSVSDVVVVYAYPGSGKSTLTKMFDGPDDSDGIPVPRTLRESVGVEKLTAIDLDFSRSRFIKEKSREEDSVIKLRGDVMLTELSNQLRKGYAGRVKCYAFTHPDIVPYDRNDGIARFYVVPLSTHVIIENIMRVIKREIALGYEQPSDFVQSYICKAVMWIFHTIMDYHWMRHDNGEVLFHLIEQKETLSDDFEFSVEHLSQLYEVAIEEDRTSESKSRSDDEDSSDSSADDDDDELAIF